MDDVKDKGWLDDLISRAELGRDYFVEVPREGILRSYEKLLGNPPDEDENELAALAR